MLGEIPRQQPKPACEASSLRLCGDDRKGKVIFKAELSGNFVPRFFVGLLHVVGEQRR